MNLTLARELLQARGYHLDLRDGKVKGRIGCRVYATRGKHEVFIINFSRFPMMGTAKFREKVNTLPGGNEAQS